MQRRRLLHPSTAISFVAGRIGCGGSAALQDPTQRAMPQITVISGVVIIAAPVFLSLLHFRFFVPQLLRQIAAPLESFEFIFVISI